MIRRRTLNDCEVNGFQYLLVDVYEMGLNFGEVDERVNITRTTSRLSLIMKSGTRKLQIRCWRIMRSFLT